MIIDEDGADKYTIGMDGFVDNNVSNNVTKLDFNLYALLKEGWNVDDITGCMADSSSDLACSAFDFGSMSAWDIQQRVNDITNWHRDLSSMASVIKWNFIVNWSVIWTWGSFEGKLDNKYFIYGKFTTKSSIGELENVFSWRCNNWFGTDGIFCPKFNWNYYQNAALVVIDQNYGSPLFGS